MTNYHLLQPGPSHSALFELLLIKTLRIKQGSSRKSIYLWLTAMPEWEWRLGRGGQWGWILSASHLSTERLQIIWVCGAVSSQAFHAFADLPSALSPDPLCQHVPIVVGTRIPTLVRLWLLVEQSRVRSKTPYSGQASRSCWSDDYTA